MIPAIRRALRRSCLPALILLFSASAFAREEGGAAQEETAFQSAAQLFMDNSRDKTGAIEALDRFLKSFPESILAPDAQFTLGEAHLQEALDILKAQAQAKKAASPSEPSPNAPEAAALNGAREAFQTVIDRFRKSGLAASAQYRLGEIAYDRRDWLASIEEFRKVEKDYPDAYPIPESWIGIVYADIALERFDEAESNLFSLGETYPNYLKEPAVLYAHGIVSLHKGDYTDAERSFRQVDSPEARYYLGRTYLVSKRPFLAASAFERLVRDYPDSDLKEQADFFIGDSFMLARDYEGAVAKYQRFLEAYPDSKLRTAALFRIGAARFQEKNYVDARTGWQSLLDRYPQDFFAPLAQYFIAESYLVSGQTRDAMFAYTKVITQFPGTVRISPLAHYKLAWAQFQVGDYDQAAQTCRNFLELYPTHALGRNVYLILGNALSALKRDNEATAAWQHIIDMAPASDAAEQALFLILQTQARLKNYDSILTSYQFMFRHLPPSQSKFRSFSYLYAAEAYLALNQVDQAQIIYETILKVYPNEPAAVYAQDGLAWCYSMKGDDAQALLERRKLKDMLEVAKSTSSFLGSNELGIADSMFNQKNYEDAYQLYDKFARDNPGSAEAPQALYQSAVSLYRLRYYSQAVETWRKLRSQYPKAPQVEAADYQAADTLFRTQKYGPAAAAYRAIIAGFPQSQQIPLASLRLAQAAFNAKDNAGAVREALALISKFPSSREATDALDLMEGVFDRSPSTDFQGALSSVVKAHPHTPIAGEAQFRLARRWFDRKNYARAAGEFQNFSVDYTGSPQLPKAQFLLAESLFQSGKYAAAVPAFTRYLGNFGSSEDSAMAIFHLAGAHYSLKEYGPAANYYQRLLEEYPNSDYVRAAQFNLALSYKGLGRLDNAQDAYRKYVEAVGLSDSSAQGALWEVFSIQKDRKDYEGALATLDQIKAAGGSGKSLVEAAYRTGEVYAAMQRPDEAILAWEKLRAMRPAADPFRLQGLIKLGEIYERTDPARAISVYEDLARNAKSAQLAKAAREKIRSLRGAKPTRTIGGSGAAD